MIPSGGGETGKAPIVDWAEYQTRQPSDDQLTEWNETLSPHLWGIVTNSTVAVIDADGEDVRLELEAELGACHVITPRKGGHFYVNTTDHPLPTRAGILPGVDIRGEGGFVNIVGGEYQVLTMPSLDSLIPYDHIPDRILNALNGQKRRLEDGQPITEGQRNDALARMAGAMRRQGMTEDEIEAGLSAVNCSRCDPPLTESEVRKIAQSIATYPTNSGYKKSVNTLPGAASLATERYKSVTQNVTESGESLAQRVEEWVKETSGWFDTAELDRELGIATAEDKQNRRLIMYRLRQQGLIALHPRYNKKSRYVDKALRAIDFKAVGKRTPLAIGWPFDIQKLVDVYPGSVVVIAGASNAGKTAFMLNVIRLNMYDFPTYYFSSEMGADELAIRLEKFPGIEINDWNFTAAERTYDFADAIIPDALNLIDYWEFIDGNFYMIAEGLRAVWEKLGTGIAVVALQKTGDRVLGRGGAFSLEKPRLYLSMDSGRLTVVKGKNWAQPTVNPKDLAVNFKLVDGCQFVTTRDWYKAEL